ncbi:RNA polymerase factor sigma-54 [Lysinibacillus sp. FSL K6-4013]|uniref:RNA polymerase factor sigma-54 n=1 Tax=Lysinibacillus sp. FSL K6-4013 TaxID=2921504 RepID=UPI003159A2FA
MKMGINLTNKMLTKLTVDQIQSLDLLQLSSLELKDFLYEKSLSNPLIAFPEPAQDTNQQKNIPPTLNMPSSAYKNSINDHHFNFEQINIYEQRLNNLYEQIPLNQKLTTVDIKILKYLIDNLDENYFLDIDLDVISNKFNVTKQKVHHLLNILKTFEPLGIGCKNIQEFLLLQMENDSNAPFLAKNIVENDFEILSDPSLTNLSKKYSAPKSEIEYALKYIKKLALKPQGTGFAKKLEHQIPDIFIETIHNELIITFNSFSKLNIEMDNEYIKLLKEHTEAKEYYQEYMKEFKSLMAGIERRNVTIYKIMEALIDLQKDFFHHGENYLKPLKLSELSDILGFHESTISRAIKHKYFQVHFGVFPLKKLFPKPIPNITKRSNSVVLLKMKIQEAIENEPKNSPYSDQKIVDILKNEGIKISRRTVTKYREELNILNSNKRQIQALLMSNQ